MKKYLVKYLLEFIVIVTGISISFYVEKQNAIQYKEELKEESLKKLKSNLHKELEGLHFDYKVHSTAKKYSDVLYNKGFELYSKDKDSLGFYLSYLKNAGTVFVENDELPMSLGEQVLFVRTHCLRTHDKRENLRSRAAEDCCPFGLRCTCTWMCVPMRVCVPKKLFHLAFVVT